MADSSVPGLVEHLFRREAGKLLAGLGRRLGPAHLDLAEDAVQDTFVLALRQWPFAGVPPNPAAWLTQTAHHRALDRLRRRAAFDRARHNLAGLVPAVIRNVEPEEQIDDQLAMMFACCDPALPQESRIALTLKVVCGFSTSEIARAFLAEEPTIAQRLVRAKRLLRETTQTIVVPPPSELPLRLDSVLHVVYLLFNEGYSAHQGDEIVRLDLCEEALRLGFLLADWPATALPKTQALAALMCFQASRLPARQGGAGELLRLADQDRSLWDRRFVFAGLRRIERAACGDEMTAYHIEAGIAAIHAQADSDETTDWPRILALYDRLLGCSPTPVVALNRAVAVTRVHGPAAGLAELEGLRASLDGYYLFHSVCADCHRANGNQDAAAAAYRAALACSCSDPERRYLNERLTDCGVRL